MRPARALAAVLRAVPAARAFRPDELEPAAERGLDDGSRRRADAAFTGLAHPGRRCDAAGDPSSARPADRDGRPHDARVERDVLGKDAARPALTILELAELQRPAEGAARTRPAPEQVLDGRARGELAIDAFGRRGGLAGRLSARAGVC